MPETATSKRPVDLEVSSLAYQNGLEYVKDYLADSDYEVLGDTTYGDRAVVIAKEKDGTLHFVDVAIRQGADGGFPVEPDLESMQIELEILALQYLSDTDQFFFDGDAVLDNLAFVMTDEEAFIRIHLNVLQAELGVDVLAGNND